MTINSQISDAVAAGKISAASQKNIERWLSGDKYKEYASEIEQLIAAEDWQTLDDAFFQILPFGTGGRRGTVGVGSNRINRVTMGESAQGLATYLADVSPANKKRGVVIAYDTRLTGIEFTQFVASVFAANDFTTYVFDGHRTTPELSFAVRHLKTAAGIVVSASHNPASDNGFKVYWEDGGQLVPPHDDKLLEISSAVPIINYQDYAAAVANKTIQLIGQEIDDLYIASVLAESVTPSRSATIVYSPLHGTGATNVQRTLEQAGFTLSVVANQATPDGNFPNVHDQLPNPELPGASNEVIAQATAEKADLGMTTDPDADRIGVVARTGNNKYEFLNGNQIASLICDHVLSALHAQNKLSAQHFICKTIVTTDLLDAIAHNYGVRSDSNLLVGFKYIAEQIRLNEDNGDQTFVFGGEESHGILKGSYTRDKDAAVGAMLIAEYASTAKDKGHDLVWQLHELYRQYGLYWETLHNIFYTGANGFSSMTRIMEGLRSTPATELAGETVVRITDRLTGTETDPRTDSPGTTVSGTKGDVLVFSLSEDNRRRITVRPSGTEAKLKLYTQLHDPISPTAEEAEVILQQQTTNAQANAILDAMIAYMDSLPAS